MLINFTGRFFRHFAGLLSPKSFFGLAERDADTLLREAVDIFNERRYRDSVDAWKAYLHLCPHDINALNNIGIALAAIGREAEAARYFDQAYALDDSHLPSIVNYANTLTGRQQAEQALELLCKARIQAPMLGGLRAAYSGILFAGGQSENAIEHAMHACLGNFDINRSMDQYLWIATYLQEDEAHLAAEHRFWAGTLAPRSHEIGPNRVVTATNVPKIRRKRLRVGYWSPDFREHSVRYFFRPLLEGHDRSQVEIFLYHDHHLNDAQTELIRVRADHFFAVAELNDEQLAELLHSHNLDVLVELAGHTSANRLDMLRYRFASLQVTGLGYPPTTGLSSIDAKFLDVNLLDDDMLALYSETPAILPQSFWCFDPKMDIPDPPPPPVLERGYITFGCFGNIGKITLSTMHCWAQILSRVPNSRLLIRAGNFADSYNKASFEQALRRCGVPLKQVELLTPVSSRDLFKSYSEDIDIVLDTFPFNGGTTTCYATYAGVPVVTRKGRALASRMGESVMTNLGMSDWVTDNADAYVERAVRAASEINVLERFRGEVRGRFQRCALGNGAIFAQHVESFYRERLENPLLPVGRNKTRVLPADELVRRALITLSYGHFDVARRIVNYCLEHYPRSGTAHILWTERLTSEGRFGEAADYLRIHRPSFDVPEDCIKSLVNEARFNCIQHRWAEVETAIRLLQEGYALDYGQRCQVRLLQCAIAAQRTGVADVVVVDTEPMPSVVRRVAVCIVTDDDVAFDRLAMRLGALVPLPGMLVEIIRCHSDTKSYTYQQVVDSNESDWLVCLHANVDFWRQDFWMHLLNAMSQCDIVGTHGAKRWDRLEWRTHAQKEKSGAYFIPSGEKSGYWEIYAFSHDPDGLGLGLEVVDGSFIAVNLRALKRFPSLRFEEDLNEAGALLEEYFCLCAARQGLQLGTSARLGISLDWRIPFNDRYLGQARMFVAKQLQFDPWFFPDDEQTLWSVSLESAPLAAKTLEVFSMDEAAKSSALAEFL